MGSDREPRENEHDHGIAETLRDEVANDTYADAKSRENQAPTSEHEGTEDEALGVFDWEDLESRFTEEMNAQTEEEAKIQADFHKLMIVSILL